MRKEAARENIPGSRNWPEIIPAQIGRPTLRKGISLLSTVRSYETV
jgi:hypothetical protein